MPIQCIGTYNSIALTHRYVLQKMMDICFDYSVKRSYIYNPFKCAVIVSDEAKHVVANRLW